MNEAEARLAEEQTASEEPAEGKDNKEEISEE